MKTYRQSKRTYYKYTTWTQPTLTSNGVMGVNDFACYANRTYNNNHVDAYQAFSPNTGFVASYLSLNVSTLYVYFQTKNYLLITNFSFHIPIVNSNNNYDGGYASNLMLEGFNMKTGKWETLSTIAGGTNMGNKTHTMDLSSNTKHYKLFRLQGTTQGVGHKDEIDISNITITAKQATTDTSSDYDFYEDSYIYKAPINEVTRYYKYDKAIVNVVGAPTVNKNLASNFSTSNYLQVPYKFNSNIGSKTWEIGGKFKITSKQYNPVYGGASGTYLLDLGVTSGNKFNVRLSSNGSSYDIANVNGSYTVELNKDYWVKLAFTGSAYILSYSLNGTNYTQDIKVTSSTVLEATTDLLCLGFRASNYLAGTIDLGQCYIKIGNQTVWTGMTYYPSSSSSYDFTKKENAYYIAS